jgi:hypothetical protein
MSTVTSTSSSLVSSVPANECKLAVSLQAVSLPAHAVLPWNDNSGDQLFPVDMLKYCLLVVPIPRVSASVL